MRSVFNRAGRSLIAVIIAVSVVVPAIGAPRHNSPALSASSIIQRLIHWILSDDPPPPLPLGDRPSVPPG
jgi:hypothetical protein